MQPVGRRSALLKTLLSFTKMQRYRSTPATMELGLCQVSRTPAQGLAWRATVPSSHLFVIPSPAQGWEAGFSCFLPKGQLDVTTSHRQTRTGSDDKLSSLISQDQTCGPAWKLSSHQQGGFSALTKPSTLPGAHRSEQPPRKGLL